jgi:hypothetical protein
MLFKDRVKSFLKCSCISKTTFCRRCDISLTTLDCWLNDKREISDELQQRMADFMAGYVRVLVELTQN